MTTPGKPYEPSECAEAFELLRAVPSLDIPYTELCFRVVNLEMQVQECQRLILTLLSRKL